MYIILYLICWEFYCERMLNFGKFFFCIFWGDQHLFFDASYVPGADLGTGDTSFEIPALTFTCCVALDKFLNFSEPQFPQR